MQPHRHDLTIIQGATFYFPFALDLTDGTVADPPNVGDGYTIGRATIRDEYGGDALVELTTDNGGVVIEHATDADGVTWSGYLFMSPEATAALTDWGDAVWDLEISDGTRVYRVLSGIATLSPESTT